MKPVRVYCAGGFGGGLENPPRLYYETKLHASRKKDACIGVYIMEHLPTGKFYIGSTQCVYTRVHQHMRALKKGVHKNSALQKEFRHTDEFLVTYSRLATIEEATRLEQLFLDERATDDRMLNKALNAYHSRDGLNHSEETKELLRQRNKEQFSCNETRKRHSNIIKKKWEDPEYRKKQTSRVTSPETKAKLSKALRERWKDPEFQSKSGRPTKPLTLNGTRHKSLSIAAKSLGVSDDTLRRWLKKESFIKDNSVLYSL